MATAPDRCVTPACGTATTLARLADVGVDGRGANHLGRALMHVRDELRGKIKT
jgi:predicted NAD-dependent protein-ADP-ribosyltransferase YbiA (DUF1768 family)